MENRAQLWTGLKNNASLVGIALLVTLGFPLLAKFMRVTTPRAAFLWKLEPIGWGLLAVAPFVLVLLTWWNWRTVRHRQQRINHQMAETGVTYFLLPRPDAPQVRADRVALWQRLSHAIPRTQHISFEVTGSETAQYFSLRAAGSSVCRALITQLMTEYPGLEVRQVEAKEQDPLWTGADTVAVWRELVPTKRDQPLEMATPDPQLAILGELALLPRGVSAGMQVLVRHDHHTRTRLMKQAAKATSKKPESGPNAIRPSSAERREVQNIDTRAGHHFVEAQVIVWAAAPLESMAWQTVNHLTDTLEAQYLPHNPLKRKAEGTGSRYGREMSAFGGEGWSARELGTLAHLVGGETSALAPRLGRARAHALPASAQACVPRDARIADFLYPTPAVVIEVLDLTGGAVVEERWEDG